MRDYIEHPYILFTGKTYYSSPGWRGYVGSFADLETACEKGREFCAANNEDWWHVVDLRTREVVDGDGEGYTGDFGMQPAKPRKRDPMYPENWR